MESKEYTEQFVKAFLSAYAALVNTLKGAGGFDEAALLERLTQYSGFLAEQNDVGAGQFLQALEASLSGRDDEADAILRRLH